MNLLHLSYWPGLLLLFVVFVAIILLMEKRFFRFIKLYWFYNRSFLSYLSTFFLLLGMGGLLFSLMDVRGPEEKIKMEVPADRTIILMDTSASMLAEDVKPSRLQKAALIAKHFARKAAGHQLSVVAFAEVQKKIVPFTNDIDLIDARLDSIENLRNQYGSSALSLAIQESVQYFRETGGEAVGNILILTDGEETAEGIDLKIPKGIHVALVGIGTERGGRIPLDDGRGFRFGYKKDRGRDVITKLNEKFFKDVTAKIPSAKYWLANSYSLPTEEILDFFQAEKVKGNDQQDMVIRPVLMEWIVIPSLLLFILSYCFKFVRIFTLGLLFIILPLHAAEKEEIELSPEVIRSMDELKAGKLSRLEKIKLADDLNRAGLKEEGGALFQENLPLPIDPEIPKEAYLNYGTSLLERGEVDKAMSLYQDLKKSAQGGQESELINKTIDQNILTYFQKEEEKKKEQEKEKNKKNQQNSDQKDNQSGSGEKNQDQNKGSSDQQNKQDKKDQNSQNKDDQKKDQDKKDQDEKDKKDGDEKKDEGKSGEDKKKEDGDEGEQEKKMPPKKIPAKLKQLMSDDRQLQMKMIENGTRELNRRKSRRSKDW